MKRMLAADDDPAIRFLIQNILRGKFELTVVGDGEQAIQCLQQDAGWDCLLLDIEMPNKNGLEVLRFAKGNPQLHHIPVIILTGVTDIRTQSSALREGVVTYFRKPFSPSQLLSVITATTRNYST